MIQQQSDTHKLLTIAGAALICLALFSVMVYAFYWDEDGHSSHGTQKNGHSEQPASGHDTGGGH